MKSARLRRGGSLRRVGRTSTTMRSWQRKRPQKTRLMLRRALVKQRQSRRLLQHDFKSRVCAYLRVICLMGVGLEQPTASASAAVRACHILFGSLCFHTPISRSQSLRLSRRPQLYTSQWESSPNTATKPTPLPSSMNTNKTSLVRFCEASLQQASVSELFIRTSSAAALGV